MATTGETADRARPGPRGAIDECTAELSLARVPLSLVDRWLPARPASFLAVVAAGAAGCWLLGLALATDRARFLGSRDWQIQPLYLATHFVVLRLFVTAYAANFVAGCRRLTIEPADARRRLEIALGGWGWLAAVVFAAPFAYCDYLYLIDPGFIEAGESSGPPGALGAADWLLGAIWTIEWVVNAYVWAIVLGFLAMTMRVLRQHRFREPLEVVLGERHYRPFLMMSAQGASIVLGFTIVSGIYVWHAQGEATDYLGLWVTAGLLVLCFVPPWMRLKNGIARRARAAADALNRDIQSGLTAVDSAAPPSGPGDAAGFGAKLDLVLKLARAGHLERLCRDLGRNEGQAMLIRLLAPLSTVIWKTIRPG
jgi:hypothetical protein